MASASIHQAIPSATVLAPVSDRERIQVIDALRGFALLGILLVNMGLFSAPFIGWVIGVPRGEAPVDRAAEFGVLWLATGKFYPLFSFLFGLGMSIQMARATERSVNFARRYARRLLVLLVFGLAHALLLWNGDILFIYALVGFVLMLFRNARPKTLLIWAAVLLTLPFVLAILSAAANAVFLSAMPMNAMTTGDFDLDRLLKDLYAQAVAVYGRGAWGQIFVWRAIEWIIVLIAFTFNSALQILGLFLLGLYAGKTGLLQNTDAHRRLFAIGARVALPVGLAANALIAWGMVREGNALTSGVMALAQAFHLFFGPLLTFGYLSAIVLLSEQAWARRLLAPLSAAGRMALSNYLMQSVICTTIFYSYGLGLYGQMGAGAGVLLSLVIWVIQLPISMIWLRFFQFGPLEWVWRALTYGKAPAMRRQGAAAL